MSELYCDTCAYCSRPNRSERRIFLDDEVSGDIGRVRKCKRGIGIVSASVKGGIDYRTELFLTETETSFCPTYKRK